MTPGAPTQGRPASQEIPMVETITDFTEAVQEHVTSGIKQAREINLAALEVARDYADLLQPANGSHDAPRGMPDPMRMIDQAYDFAGKLLELQRDYACRVVEALTPTVRETRATARERRAARERAATHETPHDKRSAAAHDKS
jgi:hypothetical protein